MWRSNLSVEILLIDIIHQTWPLNSILNRRLQYSAIISELRQIAELLMWRHLTGYQIQQAFLPNKLQIKPITITVDAANVPLLCTLSSCLCKMFTFRQALLQLRQFVTGSSPWRLRFDPRSGYIGCVVEKVAQG
jgi:hypothetical protein